LRACWAAEWSTTIDPHAALIADRTTLSGDTVSSLPPAFRVFSDRSTVSSTADEATEDQHRDERTLRPRTGLLAMFDEKVAAGALTLVNRLRKTLAP
jgi:hypothetical protein